ncbi:hypothetical protein BGZ73_006307 [Actinomortierella ambigua]|nr:hypothetical protein BGZ73_006307 [Actinomortierella ambigua]
MALVFRILTSLEFSNRSFECPFEAHGEPSDSFRCHQYDGNNILEHNGGIHPQYFPGYEPHKQRPQALHQVGQARSSVTVDQLRHILVSAANKITPPEPLMLSEDRMGNPSLTTNVSAAGVEAAATFENAKAAAQRRSILTTMTTNGTSTAVCDPSSLPATPICEEFSIERLSSPPPPMPSAVAIVSAVAAPWAHAAEILNDQPDDGGEGVGTHRIDMRECRQPEQDRGDDDDLDHHAAEDEDEDGPDTGWTLPMPRDLIEIRIDRLGLYATAPRWLANADGPFWKPWVRRKERQRILHDLSVTFPPGQVTGIVGGRGTGKTALLEVILNRLSPASPSSSASPASSWSNSSTFCMNLPTMSATTLTIHGDVYFNASRNPCLAKLDAVCGYVSKDTSFLLTHLTVRETLQYAVRLHMSSRPRQHRHQQQRCRDTSSHIGQPPPQSQTTFSFKMEQQYQYQDRVEALLDLVGLQDCADTLVGSGRCNPHGPSPGCSESQRRRLTIALQLINEPTCLMLDEPTTGLEPTEALEVMTILKTLARMGGRTVIVALHKPWATVWNELDNVTLINYKTPQDEVETRRRIEQLAQFFAEYRLHMPSPYYCEDDSNSNSNIISKFPRARTARKLRRRTPRYSSFIRATPILTQRSMVNAWRQKGLFLNRILAPCLASLMVDLYFTRIDRSPLGMLERFSYVQVQVLMSWYGAFVAENRFAVEITLLSQLAGLLKHRLPLWLIKVNFLNLWRYATEALAHGIFTGVQVECTGQQELELRCLIRNGESWMAFLRLNRFSAAECIVGMMTLSIFYRILVWVSLLIKTSRQRG